jgi:hypothetical protein
MVAPVETPPKTEKIARMGARTDLKDRRDDHGRNQGSSGGGAGPALTLEAA